MKRFETRLATKDINAVIRQLKKEKEKLEGRMLKEFFYGCCERIIQYANENISNYPIGNDVASDIMQGWDYKHGISGNSIVLKNKAEKGAYVEFGVGVVAENEPHPLASGVDYIYNIPTGHKRAGRHHDENTWRFYKTSEEQVDLQDGYYETWQTSSGKLKIITKGSPPTMFLFKAVLRFVSSHDAEIIWENIKRKYWG